MEGWQAGPDGHTAAFELLSYHFSVATASPTLVALVERLFGAFRARPQPSAVPMTPVYELIEDLASDPPRYLVGHDGVVVLDTDAPDRALDFFVWDVMESATRRCDDSVLIHAGVVALGGSAVLLPAASGSGKTTLVAALVAAGFAYLSDEMAVVRSPEGLVAPFPLPLSIKDGSLEALSGLLPDVRSDLRPFLAGRHLVRADEIRASGQPAAVTVRFVVAPRYEPGASTRLQPISRAEGLGELLHNAFNLGRVGRPGLDLLAGVVEQTVCYRLTVGELHSAVDAIKDLVVSAVPPTAGASVRAAGTV